MARTNRKEFEEKLQELRHHNHDKLRYRKRVQQEEEAEKQLKEYENRRTDRNFD